jgi:hypothetical protein
MRFRYDFRGKSAVVHAAEVPDQVLPLQALQQVTVVGVRNAIWLKGPNNRTNALSNAVRYWPGLQTLHLAGAYSWVNDHMLAVLGRTCPQLRVLCMDSCEKVTANGLLVSTRCRTFRRADEVLH